MTCRVQAQKASTPMDPLREAHGALSAIVAALKGPEYLGDDTRKRLLIHAEAVRRGLEAAERPVGMPDGWDIRGLVSVCCVCVKKGIVLAPPAEVRTDTYCPTHL